MGVLIRFYHGCITNRDGNKIAKTVSRRPINSLFSFAWLVATNDIINQRKSSIYLSQNIKMCNTKSPSTNNAVSRTRDDIMLQIAQQANSVRKTFEDVQPRKNVSSSTAAAAAALAQMNNKRKVDDSIEEKMAPPKKQATANFSRVFHSSIAHHLFTRSTNNSLSEAVPRVTPNIPPARVSPPALLSTNSSGLTNEDPLESIQVNKNDVVCAGNNINDLVGNKRFNIWVDLHSKSFSKAPTLEAQVKIARSIVNTVQDCVPQGRFLSKDVRSGKMYVIDDEKAVRVTLSILKRKTNCNDAVQIKPSSPSMAERKTYVSMAA